VVDAGTVQAIEFTINGERQQATVESRQLLVHFIRDTLGLKGTHVGCDTGSYGACSVMVDGNLVKSCMMLAPQADGADVETIEGLARNGELTPVQQAFHQKHGRYGTFAEMVTAQTLFLDVPHQGGVVQRPGYRISLEVTKDGFRALATPTAGGRFFVGDDSGYVRPGTE